jgi:hypothetical protein
MWKFPNDHSKVNNNFHVFTNEILFVYLVWMKKAAIFSNQIPCNQGTKIGVPKVFRRIPRNSFTDICGVPRNSDSYPPNTLAIREFTYSFKESLKLKDDRVRIPIKIKRGSSLFGIFFIYIFIHRNIQHYKSAFLVFFYKI